MTKQKNRFDVIIIGAGPAGSTAAYILASKGLHVLILDKSTFPRDKLCGGLLTLKTIRLLENIFELSVEFMKMQGIITYQSFNYKVASSSGDFIKGRLDYPFYFTQRAFYDEFWLQMAQKAGADFRSGEKVVALDICNKKLTTGRGDEYFGTIFLGADGALSRTRHLLSAAGYIQRQWHSQMATTLEVFIPNQNIPELTDYPAIYFGHIPWGYAWSFPGEHFRTLGIAGLNAKAGKFLRASFRNFLASLNISMEKISGCKSHALPYGNYLSLPGYNNVLLLGDACGLADPLLGEGIYYAHKSARLAAEAILDSYDDAPAAFKGYTRNLRQDIIAELRLVRLLQKIIFSLPGCWSYKILAFMLKTLPRQCEAAVQGRRSIKCFRPRSFGTK
jgi:menaquinone-9 beta-reductase